MLQQTNKPSSALLMACALAAGLLTACGTAPKTLDVSGNKATHAKNKPDVDVVIKSVSDNRVKDATLSDLGGRPMAGQEVMSWLTDSLDIRGYSLNPDASAEAGNCVVNLELRRASLTPTATSKSATIVLGARNVKTGEYHLLRGAKSSLNWMNGNGESNAALSDALDDSLSQIGKACE